MFMTFFLKWQASHSTALSPTFFLLTVLALYLFHYLYLSCSLICAYIFSTLSNLTFYYEFLPRKLPCEDLLIEEIVTFSYQRHDSFFLGGGGANGMQDLFHVKLYTKSC